jgi:Peptidase family S41
LQIYNSAIIYLQWIRLTRRCTVKLLCLLFAALLISSNASATPLSAADREAVLRETAKLIEDRYVDPAKGKMLARKIRKSGALWRNIPDAEGFAKAMSAWLRKTASDGHFALDYSATEIEENGFASSFNEAEMARWYGPQINHGIEKIERLPGNIILLDVRVFPPLPMAADVFAAMMTIAAQGDALIIDLRQNGGGSDTVNLMSGYLLPPGSKLSGSYDRPSNSYSTQTSPAWVPGRIFGSEKPIYILTSKKTFSAAEAFAYDFQALKRATIVGEVTGGGANPFEYRRVHRHFALSLPEARSINPITGTNWQDVGVKPDVPVPADQALETAVQMANAKLKK